MSAFKRAVDAYAHALHSNGLAAYAVAADALEEAGEHESAGIASMIAAGSTRLRICSKCLQPIGDDKYSLHALSPEQRARYCRPWGTCTRRPSAPLSNTEEQGAKR